MDLSDKLVRSEIIEKGKNVLVLRNKGKESHTVTLEMSGVSKSFFSLDTSSTENSNLLLTAKTIQTCLRDFYINCDGATSEASFSMPLNSAFKLIIDGVEYYFTNVQEYVNTAHERIPLKSEVLFVKDICENSTHEAGLTVKPNDPFKIKIDGQEYIFNSVQDLINRSNEIPSFKVQSFVHVSEIPVEFYDLKTSKIYPLILKENLETSSTLITEAQKHLILSPSLNENFSLSSYSFHDAYIREDGEVVGIDTTDEGRVNEDANKLSSTYKVNDSTIQSPLRHLTTSVESARISYSVKDPMLRDNLIKGYDNLVKINTSYKALDVSFHKDVHDSFVFENVALSSILIKDPVIREHSYQVFNTDNNITLNTLKVNDVIINDMLVVSKDSINSISSTSKINDVSLRDHLIVGKSNSENITTTLSIKDAALKNDLKFSYNTEVFKNNFTVKDPVTLVTLHVKYDDLNKVSTTFSLLEPVIDGHTVVPINCTGAKPETEVITFNGKFNVYLDNIKLNSQEMTIEEIKTLLANYNIRVDIKT